MMTYDPSPARDTTDQEPADCGKTELVINQDISGILVLIKTGSYHT